MEGKELHRQASEWVRSELAKEKRAICVSSFGQSLEEVFENGVNGKFKLKAPAEVEDIFAVCASMKLTMYVWDTESLLAGQGIGPMFVAG